MATSQPAPSPRPRSGAGRTDRTVPAGAAAGLVGGGLAGAVEGLVDPVVIFWVFVPVVGALVGLTAAGLTAALVRAAWWRWSRQGVAPRGWRGWPLPPLVVTSGWAWLLLGSGSIPADVLWVGWAAATGAAAAVTWALARWVDRVAPGAGDPTSSRDSGDRWDVS